MEENPMKQVCLWVLALCAVNFSTAVAQEAPDIAIFSFEDISCGAWTRAHGDEILLAHYGAWFRGFVSGYNFGNPANQVRLGAMPDPAAVAAYIDKFCRDNPLLSFVAAAVPLVQETREHRVPIPERKP
jgi:hypothetical protein